MQSSPLPPSKTAMDHLPVIESPAFATTRVLYICQDAAYDGLGFATFPQRMGWQMVDYYGCQRLAHPDNPHSKSHKTVHEEAAFLQAWLFFGLLAEVFKVVGISIDEEAFIDRYSAGGERSETAWLTTEELPSHLCAWQTVESEASHSDRDSHAKAIYAILSCAAGFAESGFGKEPHRDRLPEQERRTGGMSVESGGSPAHLHPLGIALEHRKPHLHGERGHTP